MTTRRRMAALIAAILGMLTFGTGAAMAQVDGKPEREVILVLDTSGSMSAADIASARDASQDFAMAVPEDVRVGLITFAQQPKLVVEPTTDRAELGTGLDGLRSAGATSLYDAIKLGVSTLDDAASQRRLVVLSDGGDSVQRTTLSEARRLLVDGDVVADFVAYRYGKGTTASMKSLAEVSGGRVLQVDDAGKLADAFAAIAQTAPSAPAQEENGWLSFTDWSWQVWVLASLTFVAILVTAVLLFLQFSGGVRTASNRRQVLDQIAAYGVQRKSEPDQPRERSIANAAVGWTEEVLRSRGWEERVAEQLDLAAVDMKPGEWTVLQACIAFVAGLAPVLIGLPWFIGVPVGAVVGFAGTLLFLHIRISRRRRAFADQLPDVLQLMAGSLKSGFSLPQALDAVVREDTQPAAGEFSRALAESRIGVELEPALERVAQRMASDDLRWVVMAIRIQREVGGNLAEVLLTTVSTMRERAQVRRHVRALSAEGRLSAYILLGLPFVIGAFVLWRNPNYMEPLYTTTMGIVMLVGSGILMLLGIFWMSRLIKVEV